MQAEAQHKEALSASFWLCDEVACISTPIEASKALWKALESYYSLHAQMTLPQPRMPE